MTSTDVRSNQWQPSVCLLYLFTMLGTINISAAEVEVRQLWAHTGKGFVDRTGRVWRNENKDLVYGDLADPNGNVKSLLGEGLQRTNPEPEFAAADRMSPQGGQMIVKSLANLQGFGEGLHSLTLGPSGYPWITTTRKNILRYNGKNWVRVQGEATKILFGGDGSLWATNSVKRNKKRPYSLLRWKNGTWETLSQSVISAAVDKKGQAWALVDSGNEISIATYTSGDSKTIKAPGTANSASMLAIGPGGNAWIYAVDRNDGIDIPGVYEYKAGSWTLVHDHVPYMDTTDNRPLLILPDQRVVAGNRYLPHSALSSESPSAGFLGFGFDRFNIGTDGSFWAAYSVGHVNSPRTKLVRWRQDNDWDFYELEAPLNDFAVDADGNAWASIRGIGIVQYSKGGQRIERSKEYPHSLTNDKEGRIFTIMTRRGELYVDQWDGRKFVQLSDQPIPLPKTFRPEIGYPKIAVDGEGAIWSIRQGGANLTSGTPIKLVAGKWLDCPPSQGVSVKFPTMTSGLDGSIWFATETPNTLLIAISTGRCNT